MFIYEKTNQEVLLIHLHGFASSVKSSKVSIIRDFAITTGKFSFFAMDMDYQSTTTSRVLEVLDALVKGFCKKFKKLILSGSSHGGYVSLNYLRFYSPECIERVLLFAPSYSSLKLTLEEVEYKDVQDWLEGKRELSFVECETGLEITMHREFAVDILQRGYEILEEDRINFPKTPPVDIYIAHGTKDEVVPVEHSRKFVSNVKVKLYKEVEDDHRLTNTFKNLLEEFIL
ncbi:alpha/beta hydrolase [Thermocrinis sp.]|uniref:alpha/beta hydrolase family protein n=1 Tax=Thermocrinis sp. TaxID=2024383 RepID=UPI002FDDA4EE